MYRIHVEEPNCQIYLLGCNHIWKASQYRPEIHLIGDNCSKAFLETADPPTLSDFLKLNIDGTEYPPIEERVSKECYEKLHPKIREVGRHSSFIQLIVACVYHSRMESVTRESLHESSIEEKYMNMYGDRMMGLANYDQHCTFGLEIFNALTSMLPPITPEIFETIVAQMEMYMKVFENLPEEFAGSVVNIGKLAKTDDRDDLYVSNLLKMAGENPGIAIFGMVGFLHVSRMIHILENTPGVTVECVFENPSVFEHLPGIQKMYEIGKEKAALQEPEASPTAEDVRKEIVESARTYTHNRMVEQLASIEKQFSSKLV